jgi:hypothetical protein
MSNPVEKNFNEKEKTSHIETLVYNRPEKRFMVKREYKDKNHTVEFKELTEWGLVKEIKNGFVIIIRTVESLELENPTKLVYYRMPIDFRINDNVEDGLYHYLVSNSCSDPDDSFGKRYMRISIKNVQNGVGFPCPLPSSLYKGEFPWLKITVGKSQKIDASEIEALLTNGECLGVFDNINLANRVVS